jgi:putative membrane protein
MLLAYIKAFHIISIIAWMAGLLYLPRLFVYHATSKVGSEQSETFKVMERRLLRYITTPAMIASWVFGLALVLFGVINWAHDGWFHAKLILVLALSAFHGLLAVWTKDFALDRNTRSARFYRIANEIPTILMIFIVILAVVLRLITNGSLVGKAGVRKGLAALAAAGGEVWFKVDAGRAEDIARINGVALDAHAVVRNLARCAQLCATWVQTCMFRWDGQAPSDDAIGAYLEILDRAGAAALRGVHLYGVARPSLQPEAPKVAALTGRELERIAARIRKKGLTVTVSP